VFLAGLPVWLLVPGVILWRAGLAYLYGAAQRVQARERSSWRSSGCSRPCSRRSCSSCSGIRRLASRRCGPSKNIVAVVVDDSASMAIQDGSGGQTRSAEAQRVLNSGLIKSLQQKISGPLLPAERPAGAHRET